MNDPHPSDTADLAEIRRAIVSLVEEYAELANAPGLFSPGVTPIPASGKLIGTAELVNLVESSLDGWLTSGRFNAEFESRLAEFIGVKHLLTVNSGSSANLLMIASLVKVVFSQAREMPENNFSLLNNSLLPSFLITETGIVSTLS